eukprot:6062711-Alexandrium_andersonii.AAC.1
MAGATEVCVLQPLPPKKHRPDPSALRDADADADALLDDCLQDADEEAADARALCDDMEGESMVAKRDLARGAKALSDQQFASRFNAIMKQLYPDALDGDAGDPDSDDG